MPRLDYTGIDIFENPDVCLLLESMKCADRMSAPQICADKMSAPQFFVVVAVASYTMKLIFLDMHIYFGRF